jgi:hypothetical protein
MIQGQVRKIMELGLEISGAKTLPIFRAYIMKALKKQRSGTAF